MSSAEAPALLVENVVKTYRGGTVRALDGVSLSVERGETLGIIGPNGAGKTTLLGCLLGFLRPDSGTVSVDGRAPDDLAVRAYTGYLPERLHLPAALRARDVLRSVSVLKRLAPSDRELTLALERVGLHDSEQRVGTFSKGMRQRLGLAMAMLGEPRLLVLDEPTEGIQPNIIQQIGRVIRYLRDQGRMAIVLVEQYFDFAYDLADEFVVMERGAVTLSGEKASVSKDEVLRRVSV